MRARRVTRSTLVPVLLAAFAAGAAAQNVNDPALVAALKAHREPEVQQLAFHRLDLDPADADGWAAVVRLARSTSDAATRSALRKRVDACVGAQPQLAVCRYGAGILTLQDTGGLGLAVRGGRIREALGKALEIDPLFFPARAALVQFHLDAGRLAGGSVDKARELASALADRQPDHARYLQALVAEHDGHQDEEAALLAEVHPGADEELSEGLEAAWTRLAAWWMDHRHPERAREVYERAAKARPTDSAPRLDVVRAAVAMKDFDGAAAVLDSMARFPDRHALALDYRLGQVWQAKGDLGRARAAYLRFIASPAQKDPALVEDARSQLGALH